MSRFSTVRVALVVGLAIVVGVAVGVGEPYLRAATLIVRAAGLEGWPRRMANLAAHAPIMVSPVEIPSRSGSLRGRVYRGSGRGPAALLVPGVNPAGLDEPRLDEFARAIAGAGATVVAIAPPDLTHFIISPQDTDRIADAALWLANQRTLLANRPPGIVGISFAGGLALVAAGRPRLHGRLGFVVSLGGYGDLTRVVRFLCTGVAPDGTYERPHDYGTAVVLLGVLDRLVPPEQVDPLRRAILTFMEASRLDMFDQAAARDMFERARQEEARLSEPAATWMRLVNARDVETAGPRLLPFALERASDPALSPERSPATDGDVYLLHGEHDTVIPTEETTRLAAYLRPFTTVRVLVTPLIVHAEVATDAEWSEVWKLVKFWAPLLK